MRKTRSRPRGVPWRWIGAGLAAAAVLAAWWLLPVEKWVLALQEHVSRMGVLGGVVFALAYVAAALLLFPGSALTIASGAVFGLAAGTLVAWSAATLAAALAFLIARHLARDRVEKMARRHEKFAAMDRAIREKGWKVVALLRLSPLVPFSLSNYFYGVTGVSFGPYLLASWVAMLPGSVLYVYLGAAGRAAVGASQQERNPWEWAFLGAGLLATAAVTVILTRAARRELERAKRGRQ